MDYMKGFARDNFSFLGIFLQVGGTQHDNIKKIKENPAVT